MDILTSIIALYIIVDPLGNIPIYLSIVKSADRKTASRILITSVAVATAVMLVFALAGLTAMSYFGIGLGDFTIASGVVLLAFSIQSFLRPWEEAEGPSEISLEKAVVPLAVPFLAGPAAITYVITLSSDIGIPYTLAVIIAVSLLSYATLLASRLLMKILGSLGIMVVEKIILLIAAGIGVSLIRRGLELWGLLGGVKA